MRALAVGACVAAIALAAGAAVAQDWAAAARQDLQAMQQTLKAEHPAPVVGRHAERFNAWIDAGLAETDAVAGRVNNPAAYAYALRHYANGFRDANIGVSPNWAPVDPWYAVTWPGFATAWKDGGYVVSFVKKGTRGAPPLGAKLIGCGTRTADEIAEERLDGFEGDLTQEADRVTTAPFLLWDRGNSLIANAPITCDFQVRNRKRTYNLTYAFGGDAERREAYLASVPRPTGAPSLEAWNGGFWIKAPSFVEANGWGPFVQQVEAQRDAIRAAPVVVLDFRGASDGSATQAYRLANYLWDPDFVLANSPQVGNAVYRPTPALRAYYLEVLGRQRQNELFFFAAQRTEALIREIDAALAAGQTTLQRNEATPPPENVPANPMQGKVIVLTDSRCTGPCLDAMDLLTRLPNVVHAGATTGADSIYVARSEAQLPSGNARLYYGHKGWLDRPRGDKQPHKPARAYTGDWADEAAVKAFVAGL
jgi:hypothetical protein